MFRVDSAKAICGAASDVQSNSSRLDRALSGPPSIGEPGEQSETHTENQRSTAEVAAPSKVIAGPRAVIAVCSGVTPKKQPDNNYYLAFFENSPNDLFVLDVCPDGRFVFEQVNPMVTKSTGYTRDMLVGKTPEEALTPANSGNLTAKYRQCVETCQPVEYEVTGTAPIGEVVRRTVLVPIIDNNGVVRKILGTSTDLTALRRVEEALFQAQKLEAVGQLTRGLAHDFNNLLMAIIGNLEMLTRRVSAERENALIGAALTAAERGAELTSRLLAFARRQPLKPEPIHINEAVAGIEDMLHSALGGLIRLETGLAADVPIALADGKQLDLVLLNLAINSRDAMPNGGTLRLATSYETAGPAMRPEHPPAGDYVVISVADNGTGIAPELLGRIFEPFFTTKEPGRGSGLGLSQALGFVQQSGGGVRVNSRLGVGTTIKLYLPRAPISSSLSETALEPLPQASMSRPLSVLVVDDDASVRDVTAAMLEELGHRVIAVGSGGAALEALVRGVVVDAALLDYAMPEMNGGTLAEQARRLRPELPILFMTGFAEPDGLWGANAAGLVLRKPVKPSDLAMKLAQITGVHSRQPVPRS